MSLIDDVGSKLVSDSVVGGATGWTLYKSIMKDSPDKAIAVFDTGGGSPDQTQGDAYDPLTFQVMIRGEAYGYSAAKTKADAVFTSLNNATVSGYAYMFASHSGVLSLQPDKNNRTQLVINFECMKLRS